MAISNATGQPPRVATIFCRPTKTLVSFFVFGLVLLVVSRPTKAFAADITDISPKVLVPGATVLTINGSGFGSLDTTADQVCFNKEDSGSAVAWFCTAYGTSDITSWSDSQIILTMPQDPNGQIIAGRIHVNVDGLLSDGPFYNLQPVITGVTPSATFAGARVTFSGSYFKNALGNPGYYHFRVYFNGLETSGYYTETWNSTTIDVDVPAGATTGPASVVMSLDDGSDSVTATGPVITIWTGSSNDPLSAAQQYIQRLRIDSAWTLASSGSAPIVAVIDDGVYINHPDLRNNIWVNKKEKIGNGKDDDRNGYVDDIYGWNFVYNTSEMTAYDTHGTMVAGIIGAQTNNAVGITGINGRVKIMPLTVCYPSSDTTNSGCSFPAIAKAIKYAVDNGARIINMSLGTNATTGYTTYLDSIIRYANSKQVIIVAAAGNGDVEASLGQDLNIIPQSPVCNDVAKDAIVGVAAVNATSDNLTTWSNFGSKCVDARVPGVDVVTTAVPKYNDVIAGGLYGYGNGTSFAAPIVTGVISLLMQKYPYITNTEVLKRMRRDVNANGIIDAYKLLTDKYTPPVITSITPAGIISANQVGSKTVTMLGKRFSKYTQVYIGSHKLVYKLVNSGKIVATVPLKYLSYGRNIITVVGGSKQRSIFRWLTLSKK